MKKNNILIIVAILIASIVIVNSVLFSQNITPEKLFEDVRSSYNQQFPKDFTAKVESKQLEKELQQVPEYEKINAKKPFEIKFLFIKEYGERIIVDNACMLTRNKFQDYLEVYKTFRSFLDPAITSDSFFRQYKWTIVDNNKKFYVIKMEKRGILNEYYMVYIDKKDMLIARTFYFKDKKEIGRVDITYTKSGKFTVPNVIKGYSNIVTEENKTERKDFEIILDNFKVNLNLTVDDILSDEGIDC